MVESLNEFLSTKLSLRFNIHKIRIMIFSLLVQHQGDFFSFLDKFHKNSILWLTGIFNKVIMGKLLMFLEIIIVHNWITCWFKITDLKEEKMDSFLEIDWTSEFLISQIYSNPSQFVFGLELFSYLREIKFSLVIMKNKKGTAHGLVDY